MLDGDAQPSGGPLGSLKLEREGKIGPGLTLYGLRHTVAVILREIGMEKRAIADALRQKTIEMARHDAVGAPICGPVSSHCSKPSWTNGKRTKLSNLTPESVKPREFPKQ